jgi:general secretion pathway protein G
MAAGDVRAVPGEVDVTTPGNTEQMKAAGDGLRRPRFRAGFTLAEILVAIFIIALLASVVVPAVYGRLSAARADAIIGEMQNLQNGIMLFHRDVGRYPRRLDYLDALPAGAVDACGTTISAQNAAKYRGPYINRSINLLNPGGGVTKYLLATGDSVEALLTRTTVTTTVGTQQVLQILVYGPEQSIAEAIDQRVDGVSGSSSGIIQYVGNPQPEEYIVKWTFAIRTGAC